MKRSLFSTLGKLGIVAVVASMLASPIYAGGFQIKLPGIGPKCDFGHHRCREYKAVLYVTEFYAKKGTEPGKEEYYFTMEVDKNNNRALNTEISVKGDKGRYSRNDVFQLGKVTPGSGSLFIRTTGREDDPKQDDYLGSASNTVSIPRLGNGGNVTVRRTLNAKDYSVTYIIVFSPA